MANKKKRKTIHYLRAVGNIGTVDLQESLAAARQQRHTIADTEITLGDEILRVQRSSPQALPSYWHITRYVPGEKAPTLTPRANITAESGGVQEAPLGMEFKDGECFLLVRGHHVLFLGNGISASRASEYLQLLFVSCNLPEAQTLFSLSPVANTSKLELLQRQGVKSIKLTVNAYNLSIPKKKRKNWFEKVFGKAGDELSGLIQRDDDVAEQKAAEDLIVQLELRLDGNTRASEDAKEVMQSLAEGILDRDDRRMLDGFSIVTRDGASINPMEIRLHKHHEFSILNKTIGFEPASVALETYFSELSESNLLEQ